MPEWLIAAFDRVTDLGKSVWVLVPTAIVLAIIAIGTRRRRFRACPAVVLTAVAVRLGFLIRGHRPAGTDLHRRQAR